MIAALLRIAVITLAAVSIPTARAGNFKQTQLGSPRVRDAYAGRLPAVKRMFHERGMAYPPAEIFLRLFKLDKRLELWARARNEPRFSLVKAYPICASSGSLGPKREQGDGQVPEGFYWVRGFNPSSQYHLSMQIDYPNASDQVLGRGGRLGGDIFIHGECVTIGCVPLTNELIEELYVIAVDTRDMMGSPIPVHIFPTRLDETGMRSLEAAFAAQPALVAFWRNLRGGYELFERNRRPPTVLTAKTGKYRFIP